MFPPIRQYATLSEIINYYDFIYVSNFISASNIKKLAEGKNPSTNSGHKRIKYKKNYLQDTKTILLIIILRRNDFTMGSMN